MRERISSFNKTQMMISDNFEVYHYREPYFKSLDFHSHDFYEFYLFLDGQVTYYVEDMVYELSRGDLLLIQPGRMHRPVIEREDAVYERMVLWVNRGYLRSLERKEGDITSPLDDFLSGGGCRIRLCGEELIFFRQIIIRLINAWEEKDDTAAGGLINVFVNGVCAYEPEKNGQNQGLIQEIIGYINENFTQPLTLEMLCAKFYISKYHMLRKFKQYTNSTVHEYILSKRISRARSLIRQGFSASDACLLCGFSDYSNFYKTFAAQTGMTPSEFKKTVKGSWESGIN